MEVGGIEIYPTTPKVTAAITQDVSAGLDGSIRCGRQAGSDDEEATRPVDDGGQAALVQLPTVHHGTFPQEIGVEATVRCAGFSVST